MRKVIEGAWDSLRLVIPDRVRELRVANRCPLRLEQRDKHALLPLGTEFSRSSSSSYLKWPEKPEVKRCSGHGIVTAQSIGRVPAAQPLGQLPQSFLRIKWGVGAEVIIIQIQLPIDGRHDGVDRPIILA